MDLLAIDPGNCSGYAIFRAGLLLSCGITKLETFSSDVPHASCSGAVLEMPVIYPRSKAPPGDILKLTLGVGRYYEKCLNLGIADVSLVEPRTWKGQLVKEISHARILAKLSPQEKETVRVAGLAIAKSLRGNMLDAIGIGLYKVTGKKA